MRVIQCFRAPLGGLFRHVADLARGLEERGHEVGILCGAGEYGALEAERLAALGGVCTLGLRRTAMARVPVPGDVATISVLRRWIGRDRIGIVHGHGAKGGACARLAGRLAGAATVYTPHGGSLHYTGRTASGMAYLALERMLRGAADAVVFESAFARAAFETTIGAAPPRSRIIHNGVGEAELEPVRPAPDAADLVFIGELRALKGPFVLLQALERLADQGRPLSLVIVGRGPEEAALRAAVPAGLASAVTFAPPMPARQAFARARVMVAPSLAESLPYIVLEAGAAGVPMVATRAGGIAEIFGPQAGELVPPGDPAGLAAAILAAVADPAGAERRARVLRARIAAEFSLARMIDAVAETYREVAAAAPACRVGGRFG